MDTLRRLLSGALATALAFAAALPADALKIAVPAQANNASLEDADSSLVEADDKKEVEKSPAAFSMKTFKSCGAFEDVVRETLSGAFLRYRGGPVLYGRGMDDVVFSGPALMEKSAMAVGASAGAADNSHSTTNVQVAGVDESEILKNDGKYLYYYDQTDRNVRITRISDPSKPELVKTIRVPQSFQNPELYLSEGKLVIVSGKYVNDNDYGRHWTDRSQKTVVAVYSLATPEKPKLERYLQLDGALSRSRVTDGRLYLVSQQSLRVPYASYYRGSVRDDASFGSALKGLRAADLLPRKVEIRADDKNGNVVVDGKAVAYSSSASAVASCDAVEYVMPDKETVEKYGITPDFLTISSVSLADSAESARTKVVFGNVNEIHLGDGALYLASNIYSEGAWRCPAGAYCIMPWFRSSENTLLHKFALDGKDLSYKASAVVPGTPLSQYSMDASGGDFRLVTHGWYPKRQTSVYVLGSDLKMKGSLTGLAEGEDFKTARFMGDRLYLVTFRQIDPFFAIDLSDAANLKVLGELKIPGFSTYLHPYDQNTLIGLGYGTFENQWGGTRTEGLKVDLYDVSDVKNPKQKFTFDLGGQGSYSEALNDPRTVVWNAQKKILMIPAQLRWTAGTGSYEAVDSFQGIVALKVDKNSGISQLAKMSHVDMEAVAKKRIEECSQYLKKQEKVCRKLLDGTERCTEGTGYQWVPEYCYADATDASYLASNYWSFQRDYAKRSAFAGSAAFTVADSGIRAWSMDDAFRKVGSVEFPAPEQK